MTALVLWCFSPYILGHAATLMADVPAAAMGVAATYYFWLWLRAPDWSRTIIVGAVLGVAMLCKLTLLILYPLLPMLWLVYRLRERRTMIGRDWRGQGEMLAAAMFVSMYVINCGYLFEGTFTPLGNFRFQTTLFAGCGSLDDVPPEGANRFAGTWLGTLPVPIPANMLQGIDAQRYDFERGVPSYLRDRWADHGLWYYYLYALAIKMPLGTWCLLALAVGVTVSDVWKRKPSPCAPLPEVGERKCWGQFLHPATIPQREGSKSSPPATLPEAGQGRFRAPPLPPTPL